RIMEKAYGPDHPDVMWQRYQVADCYEGMGKFDRAIVAMSATLATATRLHGLENNDTAGFLADLAHYHAEAGNLRQADRLYVLAAPIAERQCRDRPDFQGLMDYNYADLCRREARAGRTDLARRNDEPYSDTPALLNEKALALYEKSEALI